MKVVKTGKSSDGGPSLLNLTDIWAEQARLNKKGGYDTLGLGEALRTADQGGHLPIHGDIRLSVGIALKNYLDALQAECFELRECLLWKHWYREAKEGRQYELRDVQNARVEAIDMLFFWVSICQLLGLTPDDVFRLYSKKLKINLKRQAENRTQEEHPNYEDENRTVV
jgi:hypothetical protein